MQATCEFVCATEGSTAGKWGGERAAAFEDLELCNAPQKAALQADWVERVQLYARMRTIFPHDQLLCWLRVCAKMGSQQYRAFAGVFCHLQAQGL